MPSPDLDSFHMRELASAVHALLGADAGPLATFSTGLRWQPAETGVLRLLLLAAPHPGRVSSRMPLHGEGAAPFHVIAMVSPDDSRCFACLAGCSWQAAHDRLGMWSVDTRPAVTAARVLAAFAEWIESAIAREHASLLAAHAARQAQRSRPARSRAAS